MVKSFNFGQGYGFIDSLAYNRMTSAANGSGELDQDDVFIHRDQMPAGIEQGERVSFEVQVFKNQ